MKSPLSDSILIYSMWQGYLENRDMKDMLDWCKINNIDFKTIHTSGHVSSEYLAQFIEEINAEKVKIIHTEGIHNSLIEMMIYKKHLSPNNDVIVL